MAIHDRPRCQWSGRPDVLDAAASQQLAEEEGFRDASERDAYYREMLRQGVAMGKRIEASGKKPLTAKQAIRRSKAFFAKIRAEE